MALCLIEILDFRASWNPMRLGAKRSETYRCLFRCRISGHTREYSICVEIRYPCALENHHLHLKGHYELLKGCSGIILLIKNQIDHFPTFLKFKFKLNYFKTIININWLKMHEEAETKIKIYKFWLMIYNSFHIFGR